MIKAHHLDPNTFLYPLWLISLLLQLISLASNLLFLHLIFLFVFGLSFLSFHDFFFCVELLHAIDGARYLFSDLFWFLY